MNGCQVSLRSPGGDLLKAMTRELSLEIGGDRRQRRRTAPNPCRGEEALGSSVPCRSAPASGRLANRLLFVTCWEWVVSLGVGAGACQKGIYSSFH